MTTETINGLHKCQPKNEPRVGQIKTFAIIHNPARDGKKAWIKIKGESPDKGGVPYRVISVTPTGWEPDDYGNIALNVELEPTNNVGVEHDQFIPMTHDAKGAALSGVDEAKRHLIQSSNLYNLCIDEVGNRVWANIDADYQTPDFFQAAIGTLFIEASSRRTNDGVNWWSYVDKMPDKPIKI